MQDHITTRQENDQNVYTAMIILNQKPTFDWCLIW